MKKFRFTLEAVQTVRERAAREALEDYARAMRARAAAEEAWGRAEVALDNHMTDWRARLSTPFSPTEMLQHEHARELLEMRRNERAEELRAAAATLAKAQSAFQLARQKSEIVEKFHQRQRHDFNLAVLKEEQHLMDEMAAARHEPGLFEKGFAHA